MSKAFVADAVERVAATFVVAFLGVLTAAIASAGSLSALDWKSVAGSALVAGMVAAYDVIKVIGARFVGNADSASFVR